MRTALCLILATFYAAAGIGHLIATDSLTMIVPSWVPYPRETVILTGIFELAAAAAIFSPLRKIAGVLLALYAICVWPANFKHAIEAINLPSLPSTWWYHTLRLALQPVIIWWSLFATGVIDWPWRST